MTMTYDAPAAHVTAAQFAEIAGISERTVKRWLADHELPGAYQDARGRWMIPADAERQPRTGDVVQLQPPAAAGGDLAVQVAEQLTLLLDTLPSFLPIPDAAAILGISEETIRSHPEDFDVRPYGPGSYRTSVPLATIKRIRG